LFETHSFVCALYVQVDKRKEPVQPVGSFSTGTGDEAQTPKQETATRSANQNGAPPGVAYQNGALPGVAYQNGAPLGVANQNGALSGGDNKSIAPATPLSIVKFLPAPDSDVILPSGDMAPGTVVPATSPAPPSSASSFVSPPYATEFNTAGNGELVENVAGEAADDVPKAEATWDFKTYIGFDEPAEENNDAWAVADGADSIHDNDSGPLAGENVMNVIMVSAECSPWCKTGMGITISDFIPCCCSIQFA
jgi:hypothetical protein